MTTGERVVILGTRQSELAMKQTHMVIDTLQSHHPSISTSILSMTTRGDQILDRPLAKVGSKSLFTRELELALLDGRVDCVVHSLKDMPTAQPQGLVIGAVLKRENPRDAVVFSKKLSENARLESLPAGSIIGTSSNRRIAQLRHHYPHLQMRDIRGNLNTRFRKLDAEDQPYAAIILAYAGIHRLGWDDRISQIISLSPQIGKHEETDRSSTGLSETDKPMFYAVGQGAIAIQCRSDDPQMLQLLASVDHRETRWQCECERALLRRLEGGCSVPIGVYSYFSDPNTLCLTAVVCSLDGVEWLQKSSASPVSTVDDAVQLGNHVAELLLTAGCGRILDECRNTNNNNNNNNQATI